MSSTASPIPHDRIADFCRRNGVARLSLFGSVLREDFAPESDLDVLIEFLPGRAPGFFGFAGLKLELSEILERDVDLRTPADLSKYFRNEDISRGPPHSCRVVDPAVPMTAFAFSTFSTRRVITHLGVPFVATRSRADLDNDPLLAQALMRARSVFFIGLPSARDRRKRWCHEFGTLAA